jgi:hypothetical protein
LHGHYRLSESGRQWWCCHNSAKILGVIFDHELRFKEHVARAAKRGWQGVQALARLRGVRPATARQLYNATVASRTDNTVAVRFSPYLDKAMPMCAACTNRTNGSQRSNELLPDGLGRGCMRALAGLEGNPLRLNLREGGLAILHHHIHRIHRVRRLDLPVQILLVRSSNVARSNGGSLYESVAPHFLANNSLPRKKKRESGFGSRSVYELDEHRYRRYRLRE